MCVADVLGFLQGIAEKQNLTLQALADILFDCGQQRALEHRVSDAATGRIPAARNNWPLDAYKDAWAKGSK